MLAYAAARPPGLATRVKSSLRTGRQKEKSDAFFSASLLFLLESTATAPAAAATFLPMTAVDPHALARDSGNKRRALKSFRGGVKLPLTVVRFFLD